MVNSPVRAAVKNIVVRHVNTAACSGSVRSKHSQMAAMVVNV